MPYLIRPDANGTGKDDPQGTFGKVARAGRGRAIVVRALVEVVVPATGAAAHPAEGV